MADLFRWIHCGRIMPELRGGLNSSVADREWRFNQERSVLKNYRPLTIQQYPHFHMQPHCLGQGGSFNVVTQMHHFFH
jgi:hypothetical protein